MSARAMLWAVVRTDLRLQLRYGIYAAYAFVTVSYIILLRAIPMEPRLLVLPPVLLSEATAIGFLFAGALLRLERSDGVLSALAMTPLRTSRYLLSRMASLALLSALVALLVARAAVGDAVDGPLLIVTTALTTALFVAAGLAAAAWFRSLDGFVVWGGLGIGVFGLPVLPYLGFLESPLWWVFPTHPAMLLLGRAAGPVGSLEVVGATSPWLALVVLIGWVVVAFLLARRWVARHAFGRVGGDL